MKSIVIYFSHTGENYINGEIKNISKGNTEVVAETIENLTGARLFKVEKIEEYPYSYSKCCDVAKNELENNMKLELKNKLDSIDDYDVIYIGGPVWWGHYPCPLLTLLEKLDFNGKIIKPFCTHEGSYLGNIMEDIKKNCINGIIKDGLAIRGSDVGNIKEQLESWCIL